MDIFQIDRMPSLQIQNKIFFLLEKQLPLTKNIVGQGL